MAERPHLLRTLLLIAVALALLVLVFVAMLRPSAAPVVEAPAPQEPTAGATTATTSEADSAALMGLVGSQSIEAAPLGEPAAAPLQQGLGWSAWQDLGGIITSAPAAVSWGPARIDLFARGGNGELVQRAKEGSGAWTAWGTPGELRGMLLRSAPSCTSAAPNTINCVALREGYGGVTQFWWDGQRWSRNDLGGDATSAPAIVAWGRGRLSVFVRNGNGTLIHKYWQPGAADWAPPQWEAVGNGAQLFSAPSCTSRDSGIIDCFSLGPTGIVQQLYYDETAGAGARWNGWFQLTGVASFRGGSTISAVGSGRNLLDLFVRGLDTRLYQITYTGSWSSPWAAIDTRTMVAAPGCTRVGRNRIDCFGQFIDGQNQSDAYFGIAPGIQYRTAERR
jgi:hypothetical protein